MYKFSERSKNNLNECHDDLKRLFNKVIMQYNCTIICGYRGRDEQELAFNEGKSKARFGESKHNFNPSLAVDVIPSPVDWSDIERFKKLNNIVMMIAKEEEIELVWGGNFKSFKDYPHYELKER